MKRRVVVTGLGVVSSLSLKVDDLWKRVLAGESGIHQIRLFDVSEFRVQIGGDVYDWDPIDYIPGKEIKRLDRFAQFALVAGTDAVNESGICFSDYDPFRCGVIIGSGIGGLATIQDQCERMLSKGPARVAPMTIPKIMLNAAGGQLSIKYGIRGPNYSVATACASATNAIGDAFKHIQEGTSDVMITGGTEAAMTGIGLAAFQNMKALSHRVDNPAAASRPFDADRDGFVFSEGAGILVFEDLENAKRRGANILAEVIGYGTTGDAGHITQPNEDGACAARAMQDALDDAGINASDVDYINAHGTSTPLGDKAETGAIKRVFGDHAYKVAISSTKSHLGHSLGASGGIELLLSIKAILNNVVPPTINLETPDPDCDLDYTPNEPRERQIKIAMSNSFGFGGHNASIIVAGLDNGAA